MLFLLRKIRKKLMKKNRFTTYLLYAIGEIVLVVIGILIAVSLNNWNQLRIAKEKEKVLLVDFGTAIEKDSLAYQTSIQLMHLIFREYETLYKIHKGTLPADSLKNADIIRRIVGGRVVSLSNYSNIVSEILDPKIKMTILDYYDLLNRQVGLQSNYNNFVEERMRPFLAKQQLLNYGYHHQNLDTSELSGRKEGLIDVPRLLEKVAEKEVQQMLFEGTTKSQYLFGIETRLEDQRKKLRQEIKRVLSN